MTSEFQLRRFGKLHCIIEDETVPHFIFFAYFEVKNVLRETFFVNQWNHLLKWRRKWAGTKWTHDAGEYLVSSASSCFLLGKSVSITGASTSASVLLYRYRIQLLSWKYRQEAYFKGTVSWDRFQKLWKKFTELGLTKGRGWFLNFLGGSNDFKTQKVYLLRLMPFCVGLTMVSCLFLSVPLITSRV